MNRNSPTGVVRLVSSVVLMTRRSGLTQSVGIIDYCSSVVSAGCRRDRAVV